MVEKAKTASRLNAPQKREIEKERWKTEEQRNMIEDDKNEKEDEVRSLKLQLKECDLALEKYVAKEKQLNMQLDILRKDHEKTMFGQKQKQLLIELEKVGRRGFEIKEKNILEGKDLDKISDIEFVKNLENIKIYARVEPRHKMRIVAAWQKKGEVIAMIGDGINDAPSLAKANVGIAVGTGQDRLDLLGGDADKLAELEQRIADGLGFGEAPRWHHGGRWLSDIGERQVLRIGADGRVHKVLDTPGEPSGLGWLPDGTLLVVQMQEPVV